MRTEEGQRRPARVVRETALLLVVALVLAVVVKTFFVQAFYIPSESMEPGLVVNDRILVEKPSYWFGGTPQRGDVVVFDDPGDWLTPAEKTGPANGVGKVLEKVGLYPSGGHLVKRVVGVAGDTIVCCDDQGRISVNGTALSENDFIKPQRKCDGPMIPSCDWTAGPVPDGTVFVMGDNRNNSADSSFHLCKSRNAGCDPNDAYVPVDLVVGKVSALVWPLSHARVVHGPDVFDAVADPTS